MNDQSVITPISLVFEELDIELAPVSIEEIMLVKHELLQQSPICLN